MLLADEIAAMRSTQALVMPDTCHILVHDTAPDGYGEDIDAYHEGPAIPCAFKWGGSGSQSMRTGPDGLPLLVDGALVLPLDTVIGERDQVLMTHIAGTALEAPMVFAVIPPVLVGVTALRAELKRVAS